MDEMLKLNRLEYMILETLYENRKNTEKLSNLDFLDDETQKTIPEKKTSTKLDMLRKRMKK